MRARLFLIILLLALPLAMGNARQEQRARGLKVGVTREDAQAGRNVQLWAVIIGISRYQLGDQNLDGYQITNLKNAADDAQAIYDFLRSDEGGNFRDVSAGGNMILLKDEQATKANVERAFALLNKSKPQDYFVVYIAAHGALAPQRVAGSDKTVEVPYFILYDSDLRDLPNTGLPMETFRKTITSAAAKKGLVLSDTCHSGGVQLAGRDPSSTSMRANMRYLDEMDKVASGVGFISAADQLEQSYELDTLNHGVFTYSLLEALRGNADEDSNGIVTFNELVKFLRDEVPRLTEQKQHPHYNTTAIEANYLPLSVVRYTDYGMTGAPAGDFGTLVLRTPEVDDVEITVDGSSIGSLSGNSERTVKVKTGARRLLFAKGSLRRELEAVVEPGRSKIVEVNLSFSESDEEALIEPTARQVNVYLGGDRQPGKEARALFLQGVESFNKQKFDNAIGLFNRAIQKESGYTDAYVFRGRAEQSLGRKEEAVASFQAALTLRPTDFETRTLLAEARFNAGHNVDEVARELRDIINRHPNFDFARVVLADLLLWRRDLIGAERQIRRAILINPKSPPAHLILADILTYQDSRQKQHEAVSEAEKALQLFEEVSRKQVSAAHGLKRLSISHVIFGGGRYINTAALAEARHIAAKTVVRMVERDEAVENRDQHLTRARTHIDEALKLARAAGNKRRVALALDTSAQINLLKGDLARAIEDGEQALKAGAALEDLKEFPDAHFTLYSAYSSAQKFNKAAEHLRKFIDQAGSQLSAQERQSYEEEYQRVKRAAAANRQ